MQRLTNFVITYPIAALLVSVTVVGAANIVVNGIRAIRRKELF